MTIKIENVTVNSEYVSDEYPKSGFFITQFGNLFYINKENNYAIFIDNASNLLNIAKSNEGINEDFVLKLVALVSKNSKYNELT